MKLTLVSPLSFVGSVNGLLDYLENVCSELVEYHCNYCKDCGHQGQDNCICEKTLLNA